MWLGPEFQFCQISKRHIYWSLNSCLRPLASRVAGVTTPYAVSGAALTFSLEGDINTPFTCLGVTIYTLGGVSSKIRKNPNSDDSPPPSRGAAPSLLSNFWRPLLIMLEEAQIVLHSPDLESPQELPGGPHAPSMGPNLKTR